MGFLLGVMKCSGIGVAMAAQPYELPSFTMLTFMAGAWYLNLTSGKKVKEDHEGWYLGLRQWGQGLRTIESTSLTADAQ